MDGLKVPLALVLAMAAQLAAGVWWVSQQAATIEDMRGTLAQVASRMAIEGQVNLQRDVELNAEHIQQVKMRLAEEIDDIWDEINGLSMSINTVSTIRQKLAAMEVELKYVGREHDKMLDRKGGAN